MQKVVSKISLNTVLVVCAIIAAIFLLPKIIGTGSSILSIPQSIADGVNTAINKVKNFFGISNPPTPAQVAAGEAAAIQAQKDFNAHTPQRAAIGNDLLQRFQADNQLQVVCMKDQNISLIESAPNSSGGYTWYHIGRDYFYKQGQHIERGLCYLKLVDSAGMLIAYSPAADEWLHIDPYLIYLAYPS